MEFPQVPLMFYSQREMTSVELQLSWEMQGIRLENSCCLCLHCPSVGQCSVVRDVSSFEGLWLCMEEPCFSAEFRGTTEVLAVIRPLRVVFLPRLFPNRPSLTC